MNKPAKSPYKAHEMSAYVAEPVCDQSPLVALLEAVGSLKEVGRTEDNCPVFNTTARTLSALNHQALVSRSIITSGLGAIGNLMAAAANAESIDCKTLNNLGGLIESLSFSLESLFELENKLARGRPVFKEAQHEQAP